MRLPPRPLAPGLAALAFGLVALAACQDPAGVGLGLIDEEGTDPSVQVLEATAVDTLVDRRPSIGFADSAATPPQTRVLAGDVRDPIFGDARAVGYVDFLQPNGVSADAEVRSVRLEIERTYVYGDTTTALPLALREVTGAWQATLAYPPDTTFAVGPVLATATVSVGDAVVGFDLPASWVQDNAALLVGDRATFTSDFEGLALEPTAAPAPGAVFGFQAQSARTRLRVITSEDTLLYPVGEVFSSVEREALAALPPGFVPAQVNSRRSARLRVPLDAVGPLPLARAVFRASIDTSLGQDGTFVRPIAERALLYGVNEADGTRTVIAQVAVEDGVATTVRTDALTPVLQAALVGTRRFDSFELVPGAFAGSAPGNEFIPASLDILPVLRPGGAAEPPRFTLTVIGRPQP